MSVAAILHTGPALSKAGSRWLRIRNRLVLWRSPDIDAVLQALSSGPEEPVLFLDKVSGLGACELTEIKAKKSALVLGHHPDPLHLSHYREPGYEATLPLYDAFITAKQDSVAYLAGHGINVIERIVKSFDPDVHFPGDASRIGNRETSLGFIGTYEAERGRTIMHLANRGMSVAVYGNDWFSFLGKRRTSVPVKPAVIGDEYGNALRSFSIGLGFLRHRNMDQHTSRTMEIAASGCVLVAERTDEHEELFQEKKEAFFFETDEELVEIIEYLQLHPDVRKNVATAAWDRCVKSGYSYEAQMRIALRRIQAQLHS